MQGLIWLSSQSKGRLRTMMNTTKIGWIGLGRMGILMSQQLIKAGYAVTVYNRSKEKEEELKARGARAASSPAELIKQSDVIVIMVSDDRAIREIFIGDNGLTIAPATGKVIVNMSTVSPGISREMAALCKQRNNDYLDAPVSGSVKQAEAGQLVIMAGGGEGVFQKGKPILEGVGSFRVIGGRTGRGKGGKMGTN